MLAKDQLKCNLKEKNNRERNELSLYFGDGNDDYFNSQTARTSSWEEFSTDRKKKRTITISGIENRECGLALQQISRGESSPGSFLTKP